MAQPVSGADLTAVARIIADEGTNEMYRYTPGAEAGPDLWFSDDTLVNLAGTLAMEIDGDIWLLLSSGNIMRYRTGPAGGEQLPFTLENSVGTAQEPVDMYVTTGRSHRDLRCRRGRGSDPGLRQGRRHTRSSCEQRKVIRCRD